MHDFSSVPSKSGAAKENFVYNEEKHIVAGLENARFMVVSCLFG